MTDTFRALCAELIDDLEMSDWPSKLKETFRADIARARAALDEQPVGPTDDDLRGIFSRFCDNGDNGPPWIEAEEFIQTARAVLARWGQP
jgi:hypothetical protein